MIGGGVSQGEGIGRLRILGAVGKENYDGEGGDREPDAYNLRHRQFQAPRLREPRFRASAAAAKAGSLYEAEF